jgi:hypothetical protein
MASQDKVFNKNILIAVDESENARRAVSYVGQLLGGLEDFRVTILHVVPEPDEDFFPRLKKGRNGRRSAKER